jgi:hypothetical protein
MKILLIIGSLILFIIAAVYIYKHRSKPDTPNPPDPGPPDPNPPDPAPPDPNPPDPAPPDPNPPDPGPHPRQLNCGDKVIDNSICPSNCDESGGYCDFCKNNKDCGWKCNDNSECTKTTAADSSFSTLYSCKFTKCSKIMNCGDKVEDGGICPGGCPEKNGYCDSCTNKKDCGWDCSSLGDCEITDKNFKYTTLADCKKVNCPKKIECGFLCSGNDVCNTSCTCNGGICISEKVAGIGWTKEDTQKTVQYMMQLADKFGGIDVFLDNCMRNKDVVTCLVYFMASQIKSKEDKETFLNDLSKPTQMKYNDIIVFYLPSCIDYYAGKKGQWNNDFILFLKRGHEVNIDCIINWGQTKYSPSEFYVNLLKNDEFLSESGC